MKHSKVTLAAQSLRIALAKQADTLRKPVVHAIPNSNVSRAERASVDEQRSAILVSPPMQSVRKIRVLRGKRKRKQRGKIKLQQQAVKKPQPAVDKAAIETLPADETQPASEKQSASDPQQSMRVMNGARPNRRSNEVVRSLLPKPKRSSHVDESSRIFQPPPEAAPFISAHLRSPTKHSIATIVS